jgi:hypothetical protein
MHASHVPNMHLLIKHPCTSTLRCPYRHVSQRRHAPNVGCCLKGTGLPQYTYELRVGIREAARRAVSYQPNSYSSLFAMVDNFSLRAFYALFISMSLLSVLCAADAVSDLATKGRPAVDAALAKSTTCTKAKLQVRREWYVSWPLSYHCRSY